MNEKLLSVEDLRVTFFTDDGEVPAVDGVSFSVAAGETLGIVGESGCGKSVTSLAIMGLIPDPPGKIVGGRIVFAGEELLAKTEEQMRRVRGNEISMIFQEPMTSLNPVFTVGDQIAEVLQLHQGLDKKKAWAKAVEMLELVGIPSPQQRVGEYPHQLSGGMRQRVMIAMALSCRPQLLIADEPTTALDVTIQAQILDLMKKLQRETSTATVLITHDLGVVADLAQRVIVMYAGRVVEQGDALSLFREPLHPYTEGLLNSIPRLEGARERLNTIEGTVPIPGELQQGCSFAPRCPYVEDKCRRLEPVLESVGPDRAVACLRNGEIRTKGVA